MKYLTSEAKAYIKQLEKDGVDPEIVDYIFQLSCNYWYKKHIGK